MATLAGGAPVRTLVPGGVKIITGQWTGGGNDEDMVRASGSGIDSIVCIDATTGLYDITLTGRYSTLFFAGFNFTTTGLAATMLHANVVSYTSSTGVLRISIFDLATPSGHDLSTSEKMHICLILSDEGIYA